MTFLLLAALSLSARPAFLPPDADARAVVRIEAREQPRLSVSAGTLANLRQVGAGVYEVTYLPPEEPIPRVAVLTAVSGDEVSWLALPIYGAGDALVKTQPHARITVRIGDETFGPVTADASGSGLVPVIVPPGVNQAFHGKHAIELHVPATQTLQLAFGVERAPADRAQTVPLYVAVATATGQPRRGAQLSFSSSRGSISGVREVAPGLYRAELAIARGKVGAVSVSAALRDAPHFVSRAEIALEAGPARAIALRSPLQAVTAGSGPVELRARADDAAGNPSKEPLRFAASFGAVSSRRLASGEWELLLSLPASFGGRTQVEVSAHGAHASAVHVLRLDPAAARKVAFAGPSRTVRADGRSVIRLPLSVQDQYGNPTLAQPAVSADQGETGVETSGGAVYATYRPPLLHEASATHLAARLGGSVADARLDLIPDLRRAAFSPKAGYLTNFDGFSAPFAGIEAALRSDRFAPDLGLAFEVDYAVRLRDQALPALGDGVVGSSRIGLFLFDLSASYRHDLSSRTTLWVSAGPMAGLYSATSKLTGAPAQTASAFAPGAQVAAGIERRLGFAVPFLEARAGFLAAPDLPNVAGQLRMISLSGGARFEAF